MSKTLEFTHGFTTYGFGICSLKVSDKQYMCDNCHEK